MALLAVWMMLAATAARADHTLVIGGISANVWREVQRYTELADYLEDKLRGLDIEGVEIAISGSADEMADRLADGRTDLYFDSPLIAAYVARRSGARPFLRSWKKGVADYYSLIVASTRHGVHRLEDLRGRVIVFDKPHSSSGYLLPLAMLLERGLDLVAVDSPQAEVPAGSIGYLFSENDATSMLWLLKGRVAAGAVSPSDFETMAVKHGDAFRVLARSYVMPREVVMHRPHMPPRLLAAIGRVLMGMADDVAGRNALRTFSRTARFDRFPLGVDATFAPIERTLDRLVARGAL